MTTVPELKDALAEKGVDVPSGAKKADLEALVASSEPVVAPAPSVDLSDPQAPVHEPVAVEPVEASPPVTVSTSDPAADPEVPVVSEALPDSVDKDFAKAEKLVLDGLRALLKLGHSRAQLVDAVNVCVDTLYAERRDAVLAGHDDPYPTF